MRIQEELLCFLHSIAYTRPTCAGICGLCPCMLQEATTGYGTHYGQPFLENTLKSKYASQAMWYHTVMMFLVVGTKEELWTIMTQYFPYSSSLEYEKAQLARASEQFQKRRNRQATIGAHRIAARWLRLIQGRRITR